MNQKYEKYLPLGSVVLLKGAKKKLMVTGYASIDMNKKDKVYDYCGCLYPEGVITTEQTILFDHLDIEKIFCIGFSDEEQKEFSKKLKTALKEENIEKILKEARKIKDFKNLE